jgi:hypothetical protein
LAQLARPERRATVEAVRLAEPVTRGEKTSARRPVAPAVAPIAPPSASNRLALTMQRMIEDMEKGQGALDKLINGSLRGKSFSQADLLALQASMYKYSQELDLTGKVVEKATNGLKDTLKTQV